MLTMPQPLSHRLQRYCSCRGIGVTVPLFYSIASVLCAPQGHHLLPPQHARADAGRSEARGAAHPGSQAHRCGAPRLKRYRRRRPALLLRVLLLLSRHVGVGGVATACGHTRPPACIPAPLGDAAAARPRPPAELVIGNIVRRVLHIIREEVEAEQVGLPGPAGPAWGC